MYSERTPEQIKAMTQVERLCYYCDVNNISYAHMEDYCGLPSKFLKFKPNAKFSHCRFGVICDANPALNPSWLEYGNGEMQKEGVDVGVIKQDSIKHRINRLARRLRISTRQWHDNCGLPVQFYLHVMDKIPPKRVPTILAAYPNLNMEWLEKGVGGMFVGEEDENFAWNTYNTTNNNYNRSNNTTNSNNTNSNNTAGGSITFGASEEELTRVTVERDLLRAENDKLKTEIDNLKKELADEKKKFESQQIMMTSLTQTIQNLTAK